MRSSRRVVITGMGVITPLGLNVGDLWNSLTHARSAVGNLTLFDCSTFPTKIAAEVKGFDIFKIFKGETLRAPLKNLNRHAQFAIAAAKEAMDDSGLKPGSTDPERFGIYFASGEGPVDFLNFANCSLQSLKPADGSAELVDKERYLANVTRYLDGIRELEQEPGITALHIARQFGIRGPISNCLTACAASSQAIGEAGELIRRGDADVMISGGSHSMIHQLGVIGFNLLTALSTSNREPQRASRPFDLQRDGFVIAEGSGVVVLEELDRARSRGARIYGELSGYGSTADAYRLTDAHDTGRGAVQAMKLALEDAGLPAEAIDYISAHGTSTAVNDSIESVAIKQVFGGRAKQVPVSSIKSMLGHLIAAAGAVELITCLLAIRDHVIPPTINYDYPDPECDLDYVPNRARSKPVSCTLSNSFGFGGQNIALVAEKYSETEKPVSPSA